MKPRAVPRPDPSTATAWLAALILALALGFAWSGSFDGPFVLDDFSSIQNNQTLRHLGNLPEVLQPPTHAGVGGRPFLNFTYAVNYALGGPEVQGYHVVNLLIHWGAALTLFALVRRTLLTSKLEPLFGRDATPLALVVAALWALHPLQTQSVTYLSQRAESLMGLLYLLTLYFALRSSASPRPVLWQAGAVVVCALGLATKEVMATAPLLVLLYDRTFLSGSFRDAVRTRGRFYVALAATWGLLGFLMIDVAQRGIGQGYGITWYDYALTQCRAVITYVRLAFFPFPLIFDYQVVFAHSFLEVAPYAVALVVLLGGAAYALVRRPLWGFLGAWFFVILAPSSSVVPVAFSPIAESRPYLSLAAIITGVVLSLYGVVSRRWSGWIALAVGALLLALTVQRNRDYRSESTLWAVTSAQEPQHTRAHYFLGLALAREARFSEAAVELATTLQQQPDYPAAEHLLANTLASLGRMDEAIAHYQNNLRLHPDEPTIRSNLAKAFLKVGRLDEAEQEARRAAREHPEHSVAQYTLGLVLEQRGAIEPALAAYETAARVQPDLQLAHLGAADLLFSLGRYEPARAHYERVIALGPRDLVGHRGLILTLIASGQVEAAERYAQTFAQNFPTSPEACLLLGRAEIAVGRAPLARAAFERALQLRPNFPEAHAALGSLPP